MRSGEIEDAARVGIKRILAKKRISDPEYWEGLRAAIRAGLDFGLATLEAADGQIPPIPAPSLEQARLAARNGLEIGTLLRRYIVGYTLLNDFVIEEAVDAGIGGGTLAPILRSQRRAFDRLVDVVNEEYEREVAARHVSREERLAQHVRRILDGESIDTTEIPYDFEDEHLGIVTSGSQVRREIHALAKDLNRRALVIRTWDDRVYAWLGSREAESWADIERRLKFWPTHIPVAFGEPAAGISGWRLTHEQARAAFRIALRASDQVVRYADVALEASVSQDELLVSSLRRLYLNPISGRRDGEKVRQALRVYLDANRSVSVSATKLKISPETLRNRIKTYEGLIGQSLDRCMASVRAALRLEELGYLQRSS